MENKITKVKDIDIFKARQLIAELNEWASVRDVADDEAVIAFAKTLKPEKMVKIIIAERNEDAALPFCFVQINGKEPLKLERGKEIMVKESVIEVLKNAITFSHSVDDNNKLRVKHNQREMFQVLSEAA